MVNKISKPTKNYKPNYRKCEKKIPDTILGIAVTTPVKGMEGTLQWLKDTRIHKYWAFFSHLTYAEMVSINEENLELYLNSYGATETLQEGTKNKILKSIGELRARTDQLKQLNPTEFENSCAVISSILKTPISEMDLEEDGTDLTGLLKYKIKTVVEMSIKLKEGVEFIKPLLEEYAEHPSIQLDERKSAQVWLDRIKTKTFYRLKYSQALAGWKAKDDKKPEVEIKEKDLIEDNEEPACEEEVILENQIIPQPELTKNYEMILNSISPIKSEIIKEILDPIQDEEEIPWKQEVKMGNEITPHPEFIQNYDMVLNSISSIKSEIKNDILDPIQDEEETVWKQEVEMGNEITTHPEFIKNYEMVLNPISPIMSETKNEILNPIQDKDIIAWKQEVELENEMILKAEALVAELIKSPEKPIKNEIPDPEFTSNFEMVSNPIFALNIEMIPHPEFTKNYKMVLNQKTKNNETTLKRNNEKLLRKMYNQLDKFAYELKETSSMASTFLDKPITYFQNEEHSLTIALNKLKEVIKMTREFPESYSLKEEPIEVKLPALSKFNMETYMEKHVLSPYVVSQQLSNFQLGI